MQCKCVPSLVRAVPAMCHMDSRGLDARVSTLPSAFRLFRQGGYHLESLGECVAESFRGLLQLPPESPPVAELAARRMLQEEPMLRIEAAVAEAVRRHGLA